MEIRLLSVRYLAQQVEFNLFSLFLNCFITFPFLIDFFVEEHLELICRSGRDCAALLHLRSSLKVLLPAITRRMQIQLPTTEKEEEEEEATERRREREKAGAGEVAPSFSLLPPRLH